MSEKKIKRIVGGRTELEGEIIMRAFEFAKRAHGNQARFSGEPYIIHPVAIAEYLNMIKMDSDTIAAALLHDVIEDTPATIAEIYHEFGDSIGQLVEGVTKLRTVRLKKELENYQEITDRHSPYSFSRQLSILRKMFLAMAKDLRVVIIKLADRRHNMQTLRYVPQHKQYRIARETLEIYAPLAHRLGMGELKGELEDLAFPYAYPQEHRRLEARLKKVLPMQEEYIQRVINELAATLDLFEIKHTIDGRIKHVYSLFKKINKTQKPIEQIFDLVACRIIVESVEDCYSVMGLVHQLWKPLKGTIKDYIAVPKPNGYQSIHTTVFALDGRITEIQIRTRTMHEQAEHGVAAHWHYTTKYHPKDKQSQHIYAPDEETSWVKHLSELNEKLFTKQISPEEVKIDFFEDRIFVFTPSGDVHELPLGASPLDFAYHVHTDIGNHYYGAKVNGRMVNLDTRLSNGDMVEIITNKKAQPKKDWLKYAVTSHAKSIIKHHVKSS